MDWLGLGPVGPILAAILLAQHLTAPAWPVASGSPLIDPEVRNAIGQGSARVLVELRVAGGVKPEGELPNPEAVAVQQRAIVAAQRSVLSRLAGTHFSLVRQYKTVPFLALEVHADALAVLETLGDVVARVLEDATASPSGGVLGPPTRPGVGQ